MKFSKILVTNQHTANFGDDAAGVTMAIQLRQQFPDTELHFVYNWPWEKSRFLAIPYQDNQTFHHHEILFQKTDLQDAIVYVATKFIPFIRVKTNTTLSAYLDLVKSCDIVIVSPGGSNIGIYKDWISLFRVLVAVLEKKETIFALNSIGKSGNFIFDLIAKFVLKKSQVFVREGKSNQILNKWKIPNVRGVDTALSLAVDTQPSLKEVKIADDDEQSIIFIPTRLGSWHPLCSEINLPQKIQQDIIPSLISFAQDYNLKIFIIPHLYGVLSEEKFLKSIYKTFIELGMDQQKIILLEKLESFRDYEKYIAHGKIVVSMRYHGVILSIKQGIPFISLAYENKMKEACSYSGMLDYNFSLNGDQVTQKALIEAYQRVYQNRQKIADQLLSKQSILSELSRLPITYLYLKSLET
jgi:polysaccharide pyruvyl transferase WcaK-like protein